MKDLKTLSLVFLLLLVGVSCTEEVSDSLKNTDAAVSESNATKAVGKKITLTHKMSSNLSYYLHDSSSREKPCEMEATGLNFDADLYQKSDRKDAIDCVLEVEELDLYNNGLEFELKVDEYLCEYVMYVPFKFYSYPTGSTRQKQYQLSCDSVCGEANESLCTDLEGYYLTYDGNTVYTGSGNEFANKEAAQCKFDYSLETINGSKGPNCDSGYITTYQYEIRGIPEYCDDPTYTDQTSCEDPAQGNSTWHPAVCSAGAGNNSIAYIADSATIDECGGSTYNCLDGPAKEHFSGNTEYTGTIYENEDLSSFAQSWSIKAPVKNYNLGSTRSIANFSRICSNDDTKASYSTTVLFDDSTSSAGLLGYEVETLRPAYNSATPYVAEEVDYNNDGNLDYVVYADHAFMGRSDLTSVARSVAQPFYSFKCLDKSKDVKAQIRLFVREWDKQFDSDSTVMNYLSDIDAASPLMDNIYDQDGDDPWDDYKDWDDLFTGKFNSDKCGDLVYKTNPGACYKDNGEVEADCIDPDELWVDKEQICYALNLGSDQSSKTACEDEATDQMWVHDTTQTNDFYYNFPWGVI